MRLSNTGSHTAPVTRLSENPFIAFGTNFSIHSVNHTLVDIPRNLSVFLARRSTAFSIPFVAIPVPLIGISIDARASAL